MGKKTTLREKGQTEMNSKRRLPIEMEKDDWIERKSVLLNEVDWYGQGRRRGRGIGFCSWVQRSSKSWIVLERRIEERENLVLGRTPR